MMGLYVRYKFQIGPSIYCTVRATAAIAGVYDSYVIDEITGSGDMYENTSSYTCQHYDPDLSQWVSDNAKWGEFIGTTLNISLQPKVAQGVIDLSSATKISNWFLSGLVFTNVILGSPTWIGEHAFDGGFETVNVSALDHGTCNRMTSVVIPSSVTHMGEGAFAYCNLLETIEFENENYQIEDYGDAGGAIFYVHNGAGAVLDEDGYFITTVIGTDEQKEFDWRNKCNRAVGALTGVVKVYSARANKILTFKAQMRPTNPDEFAIRVMGAGYLQLVPVSSADASPVRVYTGNRIMAFKKTE